MGGVEPWLMARWKARVYDFLFVIIEHFSLAPKLLPLRRYKKTCEDSLLSGRGKSV